jgi:dTDP-4-dehydrorhamnose 3,5-epimerase-like enzyme
VKIKWPSKKVIVSEKDEKAMSFKEFKKIILK